MPKTRLLVPTAAFAALAACASAGPDFVAPNEPVPAGYAGVQASSGDKVQASATAGATAPAADSFWWQQFHDAELDRLETLATGGNLDLKVAFLRIVESRAQLQATRAQGLPSLDASAKYTREQLGLAGILKQQGYAPGPTTSATTSNFISSLEQPINLYQLGFDASWEIDLFGKVRRSVEGAQAQSVELAESRNDMLVSLRAEVAQTYLQLRAAQMLRKITAELVAQQRDVVTLTKDQQVHGLAGEVDVDTANAQLASLESQAPQYEQTVASSRHALAVLTGQEPTAFDAELGRDGELPALPAQVDVGLPSTLARRRPDIRSAEATLHAATAQIGVSVASMYPDISLTGTFGLRNIGTAYLFDWSSKFYTFGPSISLPIFHGGALVANVRIAKAEAAEAAFNYRKTVLTALQEVEDGLTSLHNDAVRSAALRQAVGADERALQIDLDAYQRGLITYVAVLQLQLQTVQARQQLAQALLSQSTDVVTLYKALGGGWQDPESAAPAAGAGPAAAASPGPSGRLAAE